LYSNHQQTIESKGNHMNTNSNNIDNGASDIMPGTNLTWAQGSAMAKDYARDHRGDNIRSRRSRRAAVKPAAALADIEASAGWGEGSLVDFIAENQRDERLFGRTPLYS
jgi:hypothetical protein